MFTVAPSETQLSLDDLTPVSRPNDLSFSGNVQKLNKVHQTPEEAIKQSYDNATMSWTLAAQEEIRSLALRKSSLTADDVWMAMDGRLEKTTNPSALGGAMKAAQKLGHIRPTDQVVKTKLPQRHRKITVWESLIVSPR